ncbi:MAG TPA: homocysteine S-methyltransferase family protein [Gemmataceae bacterium]|nr:homocysteine S-methyltransferase family protein [Gemmataceae bacterium]
MARLLEVLRSGRVLLMDGAMGTELQKVGLRPEENAAAWVFLHPERVRAVHEAYRAAGAEVFLTNTLMLNTQAWADALFQARVRPDFMLAWRTALDLIGPEAPFRLAAIGPVSGQGTQREFDNLQDLSVPGRRCDARPAHKNCRHVPEAILLETCSSPRVRLAIQRVRRGRTPPVLLSLSFLRNASGELVTFSGHPPEWFARRAKQWGVAALGVNCGKDIGMDEVIEIVRRYRKATRLPVFARPNAGTPTRTGRRWVYPLTPKAMADRLPELLEAGASMVGGCCGTTPEHTAAMRPVVEAWNGRQRRA